MKEENSTSSYIVVFFTQKYSEATEKESGKASACAREQQRIRKTKQTKNC